MTQHGQTRLKWVFVFSVQKKLSKVETFKPENVFFWNVFFKPVQQLQSSSIILGEAIHSRLAPLLGLYQFLTPNLTFAGVQWVSIQ